MAGFERIESGNGMKKRSNARRRTIPPLLPGQLNIITGEVVTEETKLAKSVRQIICQTQETNDLPEPSELTTDQLADVVIEGFKKLARYIPYLIALKKKFADGPRDENNHLKTPIKDCYTWTEFCTNCLDRTRQAIDTAIREPEAEPVALTWETKPVELAAPKNFIMLHHAVERVETVATTIVLPAEPQSEAEEPQEVTPQIDWLAKEREDIQRECFELGNLLTDAATFLVGVRHLGGERTPYYEVYTRFRTREGVERFAATLAVGAPDGRADLRPLGPGVIGFWRDWMAEKCPHTNAKMFSPPGKHYTLYLDNLDAEQMQAACLAVEELRKQVGEVLTLDVTPDTTAE
jgi:hypothetical protein